MFTEGLSSNGPCPEMHSATKAQAKTPLQSGRRERANGAV